MSKGGFLLSLGAAFLAGVYVGHWPQAAHPGRVPVEWLHSWTVLCLAPWLLTRAAKRATTRLLRRLALLKRSARGSRRAGAAAAPTPAPPPPRYVPAIKAAPPLPPSAVVCAKTGSFKVRHPHRLRATAS